MLLLMRLIPPLFNILSNSLVVAAEIVEMVRPVIAPAASWVADITEVQHTRLEGSTALWLGAWELGAAAVAGVVGAGAVVVWLVGCVCFVAVHDYCEDWWMC